MIRTCEFIPEETYARWHKASPEPGLPLVHGRGHAFIGDDFVEGQGLVDAIQGCCRHKTAQDAAAAVRELIPTLNGSWSAVVVWPEGNVIAASDRLRSIPLFYAESRSRLLLSPSAHALLNEVESPSISEDAAFEYLLAGFVTGADSLYEGIKQIQAGEILEYHPDAGGPGVMTHQYFQCFYDGNSSESEEDLECRLGELLERVLARYTGSLIGKQIVVPLSGGYDSRLIVGMLKRYGAENVLTFTYGVPGNDEATVSREVAAALGYDWEFVEYDSKAWDRCMNTEEMFRCWEHCCQGASLPLIQDFPAVRALIESGKVHDAVFVPGHSLEIPAGSHIAWELHRPENVDSLDALLQSLLDHHFLLWPGSEKVVASQEWLLERLESQLSTQDYHGSNWASVLNEKWELENRQAKFMVNSVRVYEFLGQGWALPFWDYEIMDFFLAVPPKLRWRQRLHVNTLADKLFVDDLQCLREIRRDTGEYMTDRITEDGPATFPAGPRRSRSRAALKRALSPIGVWRIAQRLKHHFTPGQFLALEHWFAGGGDPRRLTVGDALEKCSAKKHFPPALWEALKPQLSLLLIAAPYNGLASAACLAREYERLRALCEQTAGSASK